MTEETLKIATRILEEKNTRQRFLEKVKEDAAIIIYADSHDTTPIFLSERDDLREKTIGLIKADINRLQKEFDAL